MKKKKTQKKSKKHVVGFIGAGNMAHAMMKSFHKSWDMAAYDVDLKKTDEAGKKFGVIKAASIKELAGMSEVILLSVKPVNAAEALTGLKGCMSPKKTLISIVAGLTIKKIQDVIGRYPVIRVMPNTPVLVSEGTCAYATSDEYGADGIGEFLIHSACKVAIKMKEDLINSVTAVSGSGPAYFFYVAEAMMEAGLELGLDAGHLKDLIGQTMKGAGEMILKNSDLPEVLRARVTSKGGTTEQAIRVMEEKRLKDIITEAVIAAKNRAEELGK
jgi:pyrroline-5-carboxylate reductase